MNEALAEFSDRPYIEASLSQIARRARIPKGSVYQYFEDKLDLYRWLLTEETPRRKRVTGGRSARFSTRTALARLYGFTGPKSKRLTIGK